MLDAALAAIASPIAIALIAWFFRGPLEAYVSRCINHKYDERLTKLEDSLSRERETSADLRSNPLASRLQRQAVVDQRRVAALDQVWDAVKQLDSLTTYLVILSAVDWRKTADDARSNSKLRDAFKAMTSGNESFPTHDAHAARPYISETAWAYFDAYQLILGLAFARMKVIILGAGSDAMAGRDILERALKLALPDWSERIDERRLHDEHAIATELKQRLLRELRLHISGLKEDEASVQNASRIVSMVAEASDRNNLESFEIEADIKLQDVT